MDAPVFTAAHYERITSALDDVMALMKEDLGKTEGEAGMWLLDFIEKHYLPVWRKL